MRVAALQGARIPVIVVAGALGVVVTANVGWVTDALACVRVLVTHGVYAGVARRHSVEYAGACRVGTTAARDLTRDAHAWRNTRVAEVGDTRILRVYGGAVRVRVALVGVELVSDAVGVNAFEVVRERRSQQRRWRGRRLRAIGGALAAHTGEERFIGLVLASAVCAAPVARALVSIVAGGVALGAFIRGTKRLACAAPDIGVRAVVVPLVACNVHA